MRARLLPLLLTPIAAATEWTAGSIIDVRCEADSGQSYALYLPSNYSPDRAWPAIFAFDPAARGRAAVERFRAAAEEYGYIVAASNNSRNGPWEVSTRAAQAMTEDAARRFSIHALRVYTAGMSGGARVALGLALGGRIAGVIASSAGFPDSKPRKTVPFAIFGTAGTEDFNLLEMRQVDRALTSPHRLAVFEGGHLWLPSELAMEAVEWMEIQAVRANLAPDRQRVERIYQKRVAAAEAVSSEFERYLALSQLAADFDGLKDVSSFVARAAALARDRGVRKAQQRERDEEAHEQHETRRIIELEGQLASPEQGSAALVELRAAWSRLSKDANRTADSPDRRLARRVLRGLSVGANGRTVDPEYRTILEQFRLPPQGR